MSVVLHARSISSGYGEGRALVSRQPIGFNFGIDVKTGTVTEHNHELYGKSISRRVLVFPHGKGSTGGSYVLYQLARNNTGPSAIINVTTETIIAVGAIMGKIPVVDSPDKDPYEFIADGDFVRVDATEGLIVIEK